MDLVAACRVLVQVGEQGSVTRGAAVLGVPQSVASRRLAALERTLGADLLDRRARRARLTPTAQDLLPLARRLVRTADELGVAAERAGSRPRSLLVGAGPLVTPRALADVVAAGRDAELRLEVDVQDASARRTAVDERVADAAVVPVPPDRATWRVPLGVAEDAVGPGARVHLAALRVVRGAEGVRRVHLLPEDDVPHVRDPLLRLRDALGLRPGQVAVATSDAAATAAVLAGDLVVCSAAEARALDLRWRPLGELADGTWARGHTLVTGDRGEQAALGAALAVPLRRLLGVPA
ncbi:LysR family transcriptional regulator [Nocardioides zeae]|uniref:LysR family transcriptional regulator n=1 Tax=Nocardioides zeae TaxID=1457234 RepID=UPI0027D8A94A|nr:LysR family transcriptional regulator [Nocardioides zeae]